MINLTHSGHVSWVTFSPKEQAEDIHNLQSRGRWARTSPTRRFISPNQLVFILMAVSEFYVTWICFQLSLQSHLRSSAGLLSGTEGSHLRTERAACMLQFVSSVFTWVTQSPCTIQRVYSAFGEAAALWMAMLGMSSTLGIFFQVLRARIEESPEASNLSVGGCTCLHPCPFSQPSVLCQRGALQMGHTPWALPFLESRKKKGSVWLPQVICMVLLFKKKKKIMRSLYKLKTKVLPLGPSEFL